MPLAVIEKQNRRAGDGGRKDTFLNFFLLFREAARGGESDAGNDCHSSQESFAGAFGVSCKEEAGALRSLWEVWETKRVSMAAIATEVARSRSLSRKQNSSKLTSRNFLLSLALGSSISGPPVMV